MMKLAESIRIHRTQKGFTQEELGEKVFVTRQTISSWETGRTRPDLESMKLISEALGVDLSELNYGELGFVQRLQRKNVVVSLIAALLAIILGIVLTINFLYTDRGYVTLHGVSHKEMLYWQKEINIYIDTRESVYGEEQYLSIGVGSLATLGDIRNEDEMIYLPSTLFAAIPIGTTVNEDRTFERGIVSAFVFLPGDRRAEVNWIHLDTDGRLYVISRFGLFDSEGGEADFLVDVSEYIYVDEDNTIQLKNS